MSTQVERVQATVVMARDTIENPAPETWINSQPPRGKARVRNIYFDQETKELIVIYEPTF